jgi:hypothetical protein
LLAIGRADEHSSTLNLKYAYEKICFALDHSFGRRWAYGFLRAKAANDCNFNHGGNRQGLTITFTGEKEEGCG